MSEVAPYEEETLRAQLSRAREKLDSLVHVDHFDSGELLKKTQDDLRAHEMKKIAGGWIEFFGVGEGQFAVLLIGELFPFQIPRLWKLFEDGLKNFGGQKVIDHRMRKRFLFSVARPKFGRNRIEPRLYLVRVQKFQPRFPQRWP